MPNIDFSYINISFQSRNPQSKKALTRKLIKYDVKTSKRFQQSIKSGVSRIHPRILSDLGLIDI